MTFFETLTFMDRSLIHSTLHLGYHMGDKVLLLVPNARKYERPYDGPYEITQVNTNGTVRLRQGAVESTYNIRQIKPYNE